VGSGSVWLRRGTAADDDSSEQGCRGEDPQHPRAVPVFGSGV